MDLHSLVVKLKELHKELGINDYQARLCYDRFIHSTRERMRLVLVDSDQDLTE